MTKQFRFSPEQPQWESTFKKKNEIDAIEFGQGSCTYLFYFRIYIKKRSLLEKGSLVRNNPRRACVKQHTHTAARCVTLWVTSAFPLNWTKHCRLSFPVRGGEKNNSIRESRHKIWKNRSATNYVSLRLHHGSRLITSAFSLLILGPEKSNDLFPVTGK
jgi:hypothetical protein